MSPLGVLIWHVLTAELCLFSNRGRGLNCIPMEDFLCISSAHVCWRNLGHTNNTGQNAANFERCFRRTVKAATFSNLLF